MYKFKRKINIKKLIKIMSFNLENYEFQNKILCLISYKFILFFFERNLEDHKRKKKTLYIRHIFIYYTYFRNYALVCIKHLLSKIIKKKKTSSLKFFIKIVFFIKTKKLKYFVLKA